MQESKVVTVIKSLSKTERNRLVKFAESPYHNSNQDTTKLIKLIVSTIDKKPFPKDIESSEEIDTTNSVRFRKKMNEVMNIVKKFITIEYIIDDNLIMESKCIEAINKRSINKLYSILLNNNIRNIPFNETSQSYFHKYNIEKNYYEMKSFDLERYKETNTKSIIYNLDQFYTIEKLKYSCDILSRGELINIENDNILYNIINNIKNNKTDQSVTTSIYYRIYMTLVDPENTQHYSELKELVFLNTNNYPREELIIFYESCINYSIDKINRGNTEYFQELLSTYKMYIKNIYYDHRYKIDPFTFKNIVTISLRSKDFDWAESFIENYKNLLPEEYRVNAYTYHMAQVYFYKKEYNNVLNLLQKVEYSDMSYNLDSKTMLLAIYYETNETDTLFSLLDSFKVYINRHKNSLTTQTKSNYLNLLKYMKKILNINTHKPKEIQNLILEIEQTKGVTNKSWLLEKLEELR